MHAWEDNKMGNVPVMWHLGTFVEPLLQRKRNRRYIFWVCVCSLLYPACNARAPYCHLWPARLYLIFQYYLINGTIFEKEVTEHKMCVVIFFTNLSETFFVDRNERDVTKNVYWSACKVLVILVGFIWKLNFLDRFSKNTQISNFMKIRQVGAELDTRTDGRDGANSRFSQFCERTYTWICSK
jgi:hypothetical protein